MISDYEFGLVIGRERAKLVRFYDRRFRGLGDDLFQQACLELWQRQKRDGFNSQDHLKHALEQKILSRGQDHVRAVKGRSKIREAEALSSDIDLHLNLTTPENLERQVITRLDFLERVQGMTQTQKSAFGLIPCTQLPDVARKCRNRYLHANPL